MKNKKALIKHPSELSALSTLPWLRTPGRGRIVIADETVPEPQRLAWEQQLNRSYFACGCDRAAFGLGMGIIGFGAWIVLREGRWSTFSGRDVWIGVASAVVAAGIGKLTGLIRANGKLKQTVRAIQLDWKRPRISKGEISTCG